METILTVVLGAALLLIIYLFFFDDPMKETKEAYRKIKNEKNLSWEESRQLNRLILKSENTTEEEMRDKLKKMRSDSEDRSTSNQEDTRFSSDTTDDLESAASALNELWGVATGNPNSEIVQEKLQSQKRALRERMPDKNESTQQIHQTHPLTIGRLVTGNAVQIFWEWGEGFNYRLLGFRNTGAHHRDPYDPDKNGRQIVDAAERAGQTTDRPRGDGPFYYTFYLISGSQHGSKNPTTVQRSNTLLGDLLEMAEEHGAQISHRGLVRFSVDPTKINSSHDTKRERNKLRSEYQETIRGFGSKTRALNKLRKRRDEEIDKAHEMYESGAISREERDDYIDIIKDEYESARLEIKND